MEETEIVIPQYFGSTQVVKWFGDAGSQFDEPRLLLRFSPSPFLEPAGIVALASYIAARGANGHRTSISMPESDARHYLQRVDFFNVLGIDLPESFRRWPADKRFVTLRRIIDKATARTLAIETADCLETDLPGDSGSIVRAARNVFEELTVNIVDHSDRPDTGFGMAQTYPVAGGTGRLRIAVSDAGIGFLSSLQKSLEYAGRIADDSEALRLAIEHEVTRVSTRGRGWGLKQLRELGDRLSADLKAASGESLWSAKTVAGKRIYETQTISPWRGCWISFDAPLP